MMLMARMLQVMCECMRMSWVPGPKWVVILMGKLQMMKVATVCLCQAMEPLLQLVLVLMILTVFDDDLVSRFFRLVIEHFCGEARCADVRTAGVFETPDDVR